jgi:hypothetical protein
MKKNAEEFLGALDSKYYLDDLSEYEEMMYVRRAHKGKGYCLGCNIPELRAGYGKAYSGPAFAPLELIPMLLIRNDIDPNDFARAVARIDGKTIDEGAAPIIWLKHNRYLGVYWCGLDSEKVRKALELL